MHSFAADSQILLLLRQYIIDIQVLFMLCFAYRDCVSLYFGACSMFKMRRSSLWLAFSFAVVVLLSACGGGSGGPGTPSSSTTIQVVAAENFYGDIVKQLGGSHVAVTSILSNPNVDPHEYESNVQTAIAVSKAQLVVENGNGYDAWMDRLLSASPNNSRVVLVGANIADHKLPDNPHVWYGIENMPAIAQAITAALKKLDTADASTFDSNLATFRQSLILLEQKIREINKKYR